VKWVWLPTVHTQVEVSHKNPARSIELLQATAPYELGMLSVSAPNSCLYPVYVRAEVYTTGPSCCRGIFRKYCSGTVRRARWLISALLAPMCCRVTG
jgi:hypothetical protein